MPVFRFATCLMALAVVALVGAWAPQASACGGMMGGDAVSTVHGWTADDRYFVYQLREASDDEYGEEIDSELLAIFDTRSEQTEAWSLEPNDQRLKKWLAAHPLRVPSERDSCGGATLHLEHLDTAGYVEKKAGGSWEKRAFTFTAGVRSLLTFGVKRDGVLWPHGELNLQGGYLSWWSYGIEPVWSPGCTYVAWILKGVTGASNAPGPLAEVLTSPVIVRPAGPLIHIMAHGNAKQAVDPTLAALGKAGFAPHVGPTALKDRAKTVVYAWDARREAAQRIAAAVPGGATVEALSWPTPADVIVAVGRSAVR